MERRTFVMSGFGPVVLAACGGGEEGDQPSRAGVDEAATAAAARDSAMGPAAGRRGFMLLEPVNGTETAGFAVNNRGQVVGWTGAGELGDLGPMLWSRGDATRFATLGGAFSGVALSINEAGTIVGHSAVSATDSHATLWRGDGTPIDLGFLDGAHASAATDINDAGRIVGWSYVSPDNPAPIHAILWQSGRIIDLGTLGGQSSRASGINNAGVIVGWSAADDFSGTHAAMWRRGEVIDLGGLGGTLHEANAINDAGVVVGNSTLPGPSDESLSAVRWRGGTLTVLGTLGGGRAIARDVNNAGQIVGWSSLADAPDGHAALWNGDAAIDLNQFLDEATRNAGWYLADAIGISDNGWVTGDAFNSISGARRGYLLSVRQRHGPH